MILPVQINGTKESTGDFILESQMILRHQMSREVVLWKMDLRVNAGVRNEIVDNLLQSRSISCATLRHECLELSMWLVLFP